MLCKHHSAGGQQQLAEVYAIQHASMVHCIDIPTQLVSHDWTAVSRSVAHCPRLSVTTAGSKINAPVRT